LRQALPKQQLTVYYQPIIDLSDGRIIKAEALLRWLHPQRGLVLPEEFIGLAEETGFINEIGNWVFTEATARVQEWSTLLGYPFRISVNTSAVQLTHRTHGMNWGAHLRTLRLAKHSMSVEVTEGVLLHASAVVTEKLSTLQKAGIDLAIDHFGTGYSSMGYLKKFDVDYLKIDQSFVQDSTNDASNRIIAETVIVMAHKLGLKVVGVGVGTVEQRDWLMAAGCDYAQGYLFSEAISPEEFEKLLKAGRVAW
jgi:EAL domain-containing protein (putative c-di-GMP-specific phosphodiesterase class I)